MSDTFKKYGFSEKEWEMLLHLLTSCRNIEKAVLYGSRAKGNFKRFSDIDIALIGTDLSRSDLLKLNTSFNNSSLPYNADFSIFTRLKNEELIDHINRRGIVIYER